MESYEFLTDLLTTAGEGFFIADLKGELKEVNIRLADMLGYTKDELIGKHIVDISNVNVPEFSDKYKTSLVVRLESEGFVKNYETQYVRKDGSVFFAELNIKSNLDSWGNIIHFLAAVRDITERRIWEQKTKEKEVFLREILNASPNLIFVKDRNGKYVEVNNALANFFGKSPDYLVGKTDMELCEAGLLTSAEIKKIRADNLEVFANNNKKLIKEDSLTQKDGTVKWYQTIKVPIAQNGPPDYLLGVGVDITQLKQTIDLLKEKERELKDKNRNLEELNTALKIVLQQKEKDRKDIEEKVLNSIKTLVQPFLHKLKSILSNKSQKNFIGIIETNLKEVTSSFSLKMSSKYINLTASELQVADLIRKDYSNKETAKLLNMASETVSSHRKHIRKKLDLTNQKTNLSSFLKSLS